MAAAEVVFLKDAARCIERGEATGDMTWAVAEGMLGVHNKARADLARELRAILTDPERTNAQNIYYALQKLEGT